MELSQMYGNNVRECMGKIQTIDKEKILAYLENNLCNLICISEVELGKRLLLAMAFHWELRRYDLAYIQEGVEIYFQILRFCLRQADKFQGLFDDYELSVLLDEFRKLFSRPRVLLLEWDAEAEINAILFKINCDGTLKLRDIYRNLPYLSVFADQWFPQRYAMSVYGMVLQRQSKDEDEKQQEDVAKAVKRHELFDNIGIGLILFSMLLTLGLSKYLDFSASHPPSNAFSFIAIPIIITFLLTTLVYLVKVYLLKRFVPGLIAGVVVAYSSSLLSALYINSKVFSYTVIAIITAFLGTLIIIVVLGKVHFLKRVVPRLIACTIVGYAPLLLADEAWDLALNLDKWTLPLICFGALLGGWVYLFVEVFNTIQRSEKATWRAFSVLLHTWTVSLGLGFAANYVMGYMMVERVLNHSNLQQKFLYGFLPNVVKLSDTQALYPPVILAFSCIAVFIGIFLQILWHERTITDPL